MRLSAELLAAALPGRQVGAELGPGGFGLVLSAYHRGLGRAEAVKVLLQSLDDASMRERFVAEARALARLDHPPIVPVHEFVEHDGYCFLVMAFCEGGTLRERVSSLTIQDACAIGLSIAEALEYAHSRQILHRDIKPENILFTGEGLPRITDFGI